MVSAALDGEVAVRQGRAMRTLVRAVRTAGVGALCAAAVAACSSAAKPPLSSPTSGATTFSSPSLFPSAPTGAQVWSFSAMRHAQVAVTPGGYVLAGPHDLFGLGRDGKELWHHASDSDFRVVSVAGSVVIVARNNPAREEWPGSLILQVLDSASGEALWTDDQPSFVSAFDAAVFTSVCHGGQHNRIGDCKLSARDPRTGRTRWTTSTFASASVPDLRADTPNTAGLAAPPLPAYLVIESYPTGYASKTFTTVDPGSGRKLGTSVPATSAIQTKNSLVAIDKAENDKNHGCKTTLAAWNPGGKGVLWRQPFVGVVGGDGKCSSIDLRAADGDLAVVDESGRTTVRDPVTGKVRWTIAEPGVPLLIGGGYLIVSNGAGGVAAYDRATGTALWRTAAPSGGGVSRLDWDLRLLDKWLVVYSPELAGLCPRACPTVSVLELTSGSLYRATRGALVVAGNGVVVTENEDGQKAYTTSDYRAYAIQ